MTKKGITISFSEKHKKSLEDMALETSMSQAALVNLATISMLENYKQKGSFIFADLLNPNHKDR